MKLLSKGRFLEELNLIFYGYAKSWKTERLIRDRYIEEVMEALDCLTPENLTLILSLSNLPEEVRGFEDLKLNSAGMFLVSFRYSSERDNKTSVELSTGY